MKYTASLDKVAKGITIGACILVLGVIIVTSITSGGRIPLFTIVFPAVTLLAIYFYAPKSYTLSDTALIINKVMGKVQIDFNTLKEVEKIPKFEGGTIRTFGSGGFFGYYGKFYNRNIGKMSMYVTRRDTMILIKTKDDRNIIISPNDIGLFDKLSAAIHRS
jgi:hypothetical protein